MSKGQTLKSLESKISIFNIPEFLLFEVEDILDSLDEVTSKIKNQFSKHTKHSKNVLECTQDTLDHYGRKHVPKCHQKCPQKSESGRSLGPPGIKNPPLKKKKNSLNKKKIIWREKKAQLCWPRFFSGTFFDAFWKVFFVDKILAHPRSSPDAPQGRLWDHLCTYLGLLGFSFPTFSQNCRHLK